jgi:hypothetical protein
MMRCHSQKGINDLATPFLVVFLANAINEDLTAVCTRKVRLCVHCVCARAR